MNFDHPDHSLQGSRLNSCTRIVILVVMVASSHLSYLSFFNYFSSREACPHALGWAVHAWEGGLGGKTLVRTPKLQRWVEIFLTHEQLVLHEF
jgi:hypothetical protein